MHARKTAEFRKSLVITPESLQRLIRALPAGRDGIQFELTCSDGTTLHPKDIGELLEFPNPRTREIRALDLSTSYADDERWSLSFSSGISGPASYIASGNDVYVLSTSDTIEHHLESMAGAGPHLLSRSDVFPLLFAPMAFGFGLVVALSGLGMCLAALTAHKYLYLGNFRVGGFLSFLLLLFGVVICSLGAKSQGLISYFFPKVAFCIGDGAARHAKMIDRRKTYGIGAAVTLVLGVISGWLAAFLPTH
jgi:hypothetical protein